MTLRVLGAWLLAFFASVSGHASDLHINHIQFVGSHNSYKQAMSGGYRALLGLINEEAAKALDYEHPPLQQQLDAGLRKLELDVFYQADPAKFPVGHVQVIDMNSHCTTLRQCLTGLARWSDANPNHEPIWVSFNAKDQKISWLPDPTPFDDSAFRAMDRVVERALGERLIRPQDVRPVDSTKPVWPRLDQARGKFLLILDEGGAKRDLYAGDWRSRPMFVNVGPDHPGAAVMIVNDPVADFQRIQTLVNAGFMVRTRADADTREARINDAQRRQAAFASGAQAISTDYYLPTNPFGNAYRVHVSGAIQCNPVTAPQGCSQTLSRDE